MVFQIAIKDFTFGEIFFHHPKLTLLRVIKITRSLVYGDNCAIVEVASARETICPRKVAYYCTLVKNK